MIDETLKATNRCVMCGLCLPHCPTYGVSRQEADSPRGRVSLIQALNEGKLSANGALVQHLDRCLTCRACEAVCPAKVPYGELIDGARKILRKRRSWIARLSVILFGQLSSKRLLRKSLAWGLSVYRRAGLQRLFRITRWPPLIRLRRSEAFLGHIHDDTVTFDKGLQPERDGSIGLFTGCLAEILDRDTLNASARLLKCLGYRVWIPSVQTCCGALHQHNGETKQALTLMRRNLMAFDSLKIQSILSTATGCGAHLSEYEKHLPGDKGKNLCSRHADICSFLAQNLGPDLVDIASLKAKVLVHTPCSLTHVLRQQNLPFKLLSLIPSIELVGFPDNAICCGAAGSYMITQPQMSDALLEKKLEAIRDLKPSIIVTSNIGCRLHLQAGLRRENLDIEVLHPVTLLERQIKAQNTIETQSRHSCLN